MGSDIGGAVEIMEPRDLAWYLAAEGDFGLTRNYMLFAALCGVRQRWEGLIEPISEPRGAPADASPSVAIEADDPGFTCSWVTTDELEEAHYRAVNAGRRVHEDRGWLTGAEPLLAFMRALEVGNRKVRFIFWID